MTLGGSVNLSDLSARFYARIVRPRFISERYLLPHIRRVARLEGRDVLDFGCGPACNTFMFQPRHYVGIDVDPGRVAYARRLFPEYRFELCVGTTLPTKAATVDLVFVCGVLHHLSDAECGEIVREFRRVLRPGGQVLVLEPVLSTSWPVHTAVMRLFDAGSFLRDECGYMRLLKDHFDVVLHGTVRTPNLYNTVILTGGLRGLEESRDISGRVHVG